MNQITPAAPSDLPALCELLALLFDQEAEFQPDRAAQERGLAALLQSPERGDILVARREGRVVGMVTLQYVVSTALGGPAALLEDMVVDPAARGAGLGSELLKSAVDLARARGCRRVTLLTDADNQAARRFYARHGSTGSPMTPLRLLL